MIDLHSHLIPGVDDGAADLAQARDALALLREEGTRAVVATPHFRGSLTHSAPALAARMAELDDGWRALRELARGEFGALRVERGAEVMLDAPEVDLSDPRLRLAGTGFALVEFAGFMVPPRSAEALSRLSRGGVRPVLAHPERYVNLAEHPGVAGAWRDAGAVLQVNTGSLLGRYGAGSRRAAHRLLAEGWADLLASDYHAVGPATVRECRELLRGTGREEDVHLLLEGNPQRILDGLPPLPVGPLGRRPGWWERVRGALRIRRD